MKPMRILLAHEGSAGAEQAADLIQAINWPVGSMLRLISVVEPLTVAVDAVSSISADAESQVDDYTQAELSATTERLSSANLTVQSAVLRGRPATAIVDEARAFDADLVVVGSRGHGVIASLVLGSVSNEVVDHAPCPVLVARQTTMSRVVFATDGSASATRAQDLLAEWPIFDGVTIRVVSVADVPRTWHTGIAPTMYAQVMNAYAMDVEVAKQEHEQIAADSVRALTTAGRAASSETLVGDAAAEVIATAASFGADLIVLGSRGRTGLTRLLLGSVARNVLQGSAASILVVHDSGTSGVAPTS
jgi:nucleotide-binding universal stress UspA family protein